MWHPPVNVVENPDLRNHAAVFIDRVDAGKQLAALLHDWRGRDAIVIAIPAGGVPLGIVVAKELGLPFNVMVVSKMTLPWNTEAGYGAMAADGTVQVNQALVAATGMDADAVENGIELTRKKVAQREQHYRQLIAARPLRHKSVILVDDGLASGFTLRVAIDSARARHAGDIVVAVPTGLHISIDRVARECDRLYCVNIREGLRFAVADAYRQWTDVSEEEVVELLKQAA